MRFKVAKRDLEAALNVVAGSLAKTGSDISTHYLFRVTDPSEGETAHGVEVLTYAGRVFSSCPLIASVSNIQDDGKRAFTVEAKRLNQWLQNVQDAALEFTLDGSEVVAKAPKGKQTFQSLDPDSFPYWDKLLKKAEVKATLPADRLSSALSYSKLFASDRESSHPELCVCEVKPQEVDETGKVTKEGGILYSTDKKAVTLIRIAGMEESGMRIHAKDAGGFLSFLGTFDGTSVEVLEHARSLIFRRKDGAIFGETRFQTGFPGLNIKMDDEDQHLWVLSKDEIEEAIGFLVAGAAWEDNRLRFKPGKKDGEVILSMASVTGKITELELEAIKMSSVDDAPEVPEEGFAIDHFCLAKVLNWWKDDAVKFGISVMGNRGYVRFVVEQGNDKYLTIIAWLR